MREAVICEPVRTPIAAGDGSWYAGRPSLWIGPASGHPSVFAVGTGDNDLVVAGGAESMSNVVFSSTDMRWGATRSGMRVHDGLARGRTTAGGRHYPAPGGMRRPRVPTPRGNR
jgi:hypothetical protein